MLILPFRTFLAWLNLEFGYGTESCFVEGLSAFWSSWLQFIFPLYIWSIVRVIIFVRRHSTRLTKTFGDRALPLLATLFLMSYLKLLCTVVDICVYTTLTVYPSESKIVVTVVHRWKFAYTAISSYFLLLQQSLCLSTCHIHWSYFHPMAEEIQSLRVLRWILKFNPVFDAYLASFEGQISLLVWNTIET